MSRRTTFWCPTAISITSPTWHPSPNAPVPWSWPSSNWRNGFEKKHDLQNTMAMNLGGCVTLPFGRVKMTPAWHSAQLPDGSYGGTPCGFLLYLEDGVIYFACDTALFSDMKLIASQQGQPGGRADRRSVHDGPFRCRGRDSADRTDEGSPRPLQHVATDRAGPVRVGQEDRGDDSCRTGRGGTRRKDHALVLRRSLLSARTVRRNPRAYAEGSVRPGRGSGPRGTATWISSPTTRTGKLSILIRGLSHHVPSEIRNRHACQGQLTTPSSTYPPANDAPMCGHKSSMAK